MTPEQIRDYEYPGMYGQKRATESDPPQPYTGSQVHGAMPPSATRSEFDAMAGSERVKLLQDGGVVTENEWHRHTPEPAVPTGAQLEGRSFHASLVSTTLHPGPATHGWIDEVNPITFPPPSPGWGKIEFPDPYEHDPYEDCYDTEMRFSGATLAWSIGIALIVGAIAYAYVSPYVHGLG